MLSHQGLKLRFLATKLISLVLIAGASQTFAVGRVPDLTFGCSFIFRGGDLFQQVGQYSTLLQSTTGSTSDSFTDSNGETGDYTVDFSLKSDSHRLKIDFFVPKSNKHETLSVPGPFENKTVYQQKFFADFGTRQNWTLPANFTNFQATELDIGCWTTPLAPEVSPFVCADPKVAGPCPNNLIPITEDCPEGQNRCDHP